MRDENRHYVYVYRTKSGKPLYVGYGASILRSAAHLGTRAHNEKLKLALASGDYTLEIAGPFGDEQRAKAVETALISTFRLEPTLCNDNGGHALWRFRALGVPNAFVRRVDQPALDRTAWRKVAKRAGGIIFVYISDCDLGDGRRGDMLANIPDNDVLVKRVDRHWQLRKHAANNWVLDRTSSPGLLVGLSGLGSMRMVIASVRIDKRGWEAAVVADEPDGLVTIPLLAESTATLDAYQLRGRRLGLDVGLWFGALRHQGFIVMDAGGAIVKGGRK